MTADVDQYVTKNTDSGIEHRQVQGTTSNVVSAGVVTGLVQAVVIGGIHQHHAPKPPMPTPRQLASAPAGFVGRDDQLAARPHHTPRLIAGR